MLMLGNAMMFLTWGVGRINVDYRIGQVTHVMEELVASLFRCWRTGKPDNTPTANGEGSHRLPFDTLSTGHP